MIKHLQPVSEVMKELVEDYNTALRRIQDELNWNYCAMGRKYGVSDNAIRKWEKTYQKYGI